MPILLTKFLRLVRRVLGLTRRHMILTAKSVDVLLRVLISYRYQSFKPYLAGCDECLILGNGPSLNEAIKELPALRKGRDVFCVNYFAMTDYYVDIKPSHYVLLDSAFWLEDVTDETSRKRDELFAQIEKVTDWPLVLFVPHAAKASRTWMQRNGFNNSNVTICYFNHTPIDSTEIYTYFRYFLYKYNFGMTPANNVLVAAIFLAINLGYKQIFLFGADHSWHEEISVGFDNILRIKQEHFYDQREAHVPVYKAGHGEPSRIYEFFECLFYAFKGYILLEEYAIQRGAKIYNASSKSYIDAFERIAVADIKSIDDH